MQSKNHLLIVIDTKLEMNLKSSNKGLHFDNVRKVKINTYFIGFIISIIYKPVHTKTYCIKTTTTY